MMGTRHVPMYRDGKHYDLVNKDCWSDIPFYLKFASEARGPVLEIACGTGRITIPLARSGIDITGLDISTSMLREAKVKAQRTGLEIPWVKADCRRFAIGRKFALIFIPFNSMQHLHDRESLERFFAAVRRHLTPRGRFILDVFNPSVAILSRDPRKRFPVSRYPDPDGRGEVVLEETNVYDDATQVNRVLWYFSVGRRRDARIENLDLRCFYPQELDALLRYNGFRIVKKFGDFKERPFSSGAMKQIVLCEKR